MKKEIIKLLEEEIRWCKKNPTNAPKEWMKGFVDGIKQAILLTKKVKPFNPFERK